MEVSLLELNHVIGTKKLEVLKKYRRMSIITDFAILQGGIVSYDGNLESDNRTSYYWTKSACDNVAFIYGIDKLGRLRRCKFDYTFLGIRPILNFSSISKLCLNKKYNEFNVLEIEFGEYPKSAAKEELQKILEDLYKNNKLLKTNKKYCTLSDTYVEYEYNNQKYIRVSSKKSCKAKLSNNFCYCESDNVWIKIEPIKWLVDKENDIAVAKDILSSGIPFNNFNNYINNNNFEKTEMYKFLNEYFIKDITQGIKNELEVKVIEEKINKEIELENLEKNKQKLLSLKSKFIK